MDIERIRKRDGNRGERKRGEKEKYSVRERAGRGRERSKEKRRNEEKQEKGISEWKRVWGAGRGRRDGKKKSPDKGECRD